MAEDRYARVHGADGCAPAGVRKWHQNELFMLSEAYGVFLIQSGGPWMLVVIS